MPQRRGALAGIGKTSVVRLSSLPGPDVAEVWIKLEAAKPTGSYKDRTVTSSARHLV
jgi:cysteine synthase A